jgi:hypothetical protein
MLIRLSTVEREAILALMPHCDEWGHAVVPAAPEVTTGGADEELTVAQRIHLIGRLLVPQEAIEKEEGLDALVGVLDTRVSRSTCSYATSTVQLRPRSAMKNEA